MTPADVTAIAGAVVLVGGFALKARFDVTDRRERREAEAQAKEERRLGAERARAAEAEAKEERRIAAEKAAEAAEHLDEQDKTLGEIHTASNSNLAAAEARVKAGEEKIQQMADQAVKKIEEHMATLTAELKKRDDQKAAEQLERDHQNGYDEPRSRPRRPPPNRRR